MASTTIAKCVYRVRQITRDFSASEPKRYLPEILDALDRALNAISGKLPGAIGQNTTIISLVAGDNSYPLSGEYHTLNEFQIASTGEPVRVESMPTLMRYRAGSPTAPGTPLLIAFTETAAGVVTAEVWPAPTQSDSIIGLRALAPTHVFQGTAANDLTATSLDFGVYGTEAIIYRACSELYAGTPEADTYMALSNEALLAEKYRVSRQRSGSLMGKQV